MRTAAKAPPITTLRIVWGAVFSSTFLFLLVLNIVERPEQAPEMTMVLALGMAAASSAAVGLVFPGLMYKRALSDARIPTREEKDPESPEAFATTRTVAQDPARARTVAMAGYTTKTILGSALGESVCIFGLVLGFLGLEVPLTLPFFVVGWAVMASHFPSEARMERLVEQALNIRL